MANKLKHIKTHTYALSTNPTVEQIFQAFADWIFNDVPDKIELRDLANLDERLKKVGSGFRIEFVPMPKKMGRPRKNKS